jgi:hypothetical protein
MRRGRDRMRTSRTARQGYQSDTYSPGEYRRVPILRAWPRFPAPFCPREPGPPLPIPPLLDTPQRRWLEVASSESCRVLRAGHWRAASDDFDPKPFGLSSGLCDLRHSARVAVLISLRRESPVARLPYPIGRANGPDLSQPSPGGRGTSGLRAAAFTD